MKNRQGIIWAPILIIVATILVTGVSGYFLYKAGNTNESKNTNVGVVNQANNNIAGSLDTNVAINTNQTVNSNASINTNTAANTNTVSNANTATDPIAGWRTYTNSQYKISFKHPADWTPKTINDPYYNDKAILTTLQNPGFQEPYGAVGGIFINVYANRNISQPLNTWFSEHRERTEEKIMAGINGPCTGTAQRSDITVTITDETVSGLNAKAQYEKDLRPTYCEGGATTSKSFYVKKDTAVYEIIASSVTSAEADTLLATFDTIMSTFQFTN